MMMECGDEWLEAGDVVIVHLLLVVIQTGGDAVLLRQQRTREPAVVNLRQRLPLDLVFQSWVLGMILTADAAPKHGILRLGVKHHTIKIE